MSEQESIQTQKQEPKPEPIFHEVTVRRVVEEVEDVISLYFDHDKNKIKYKPGNSFRIYPDPENKQLYRPFSIASSPTEVPLTISIGITNLNSFVSFKTTK